jgi:hypothetical protein
LLSKIEGNVLGFIRDEVERYRGEHGSAVVIFTSPERTEVNPWKETFVLSHAGNNPMREPILVVPRKTATQLSLFILHQQAEVSCRAFNIRQLKHALRAATAYALDIPMLMPYASWDFLGNDSNLSRIEECEFGPAELNELVHSIGSRYDAEHIRSTITAFYQRQQALEPWWPALGEELLRVHQQTTNWKWASFPKHVQEVVRHIESDPCTYTWENKFLDTLINPHDIHQTWKDIEVEERIKDTLAQLVRQHLAPQNSAHGILAQARISGALLYGPPGTGKTHLARILARESKATMLSISVASLDHAYIGMSIQALFKLSRMLHPAIIFIDEADGIFGSRQMDTHEVSKLRKNQFLAEMDGMLQHANAPFVLLATNLPHLLDHAVLRRIPTFLHLGLPQAHMRKHIFGTYLRDEYVEEDVDMEVLVERTPGYSGSDIKALCVKTALLCECFVEREGRRVRQLKNEHFLEALKRSAPTVSPSALEDIDAFAKMYDPAALVESMEGEPVVL